MNSDLDTLSFGSEIWTITFHEEVDIKFSDMWSNVALASSKAESMRLLIETLKFLIIAQGRLLFLTQHYQN